MSIESRLFGRRDVFAIEVGLEVKRESRELGRICWWLSGRRVGDWEDTAYVVGCVNWHRDLLLEQKPQIVPELFDESPSEAFRII